MTTIENHPVPTLSASIKHRSSGEPYLEGFQCAACGEVVIEAKRCCPKCAQVDSLQPVTLKQRGTLFSYTIVHRSFPGIKTPFISAVVALDGGGFLRGNLVDIPASPDHLHAGMLLDVVIEEIELANPDQPKALRYAFRPRAPH